MSFPVSGTGSVAVDLLGPVGCRGRSLWIGLQVLDQTWGVLWPVEHLRLFARSFLPCVSGKKKVIQGEREFNDMTDTDKTGEDMQPDQK